MLLSGLELAVERTLLPALAAAFRWRRRRRQPPSFAAGSGRAAKDEKEEGSDDCGETEEAEYEAEATTLAERRWTAFAMLATVLPGQSDDATFPLVGSTWSKSSSTHSA